MFYNTRIIRVLLIEDEPGDVKLIETHLRQIHSRQPFQLRRADRLSRGIELLAEESFDVIVCDLGLPDSKGMTTFERIYEQVPHLPIIVLTGTIDDSLGLLAVKRGAQDFLIKDDISASLLLHSLLYAIERNELVRKLEEAQRSARLSNWELNLATNELSCSRITYDILSRSPQRKLETLADYIESAHPEDQTALALAFKRACEGSEELQTQHRVLLPDGGIRYIAVQGKLRQAANEGGPPLLVGTSQDITDRVETQLAQRTAQIRQEFLAKTSHEIRTPLNPILMLTDQLLRSSLTQEQRHALETIRTASDTLLAVVNDILDLAKIEAGRIDFFRHVFRLHDVFSAVNNMVELNAQSKRLDFSMDIAADTQLLLVGDDVRLTQILLNLINNAIKFTRKGRISVHAETVRQDGERVQILFTVRDTGIGIPQDKLKKIFEMFQQVESDVLRQYGGSGLGLTIVNQLVTLQGGSIEVESEEGVGSVFRVMLEYEIGHDTEQEREQKPEVDRSLLQGLRVLLAEDNPLNQMVIQGLLESCGVTLDIANNGREGVEMFFAERYELVLMDIQMPEMDGIEAARLIRARRHPGQPEVPIIALTANPDASVAAGMNDHVSKPVDVETLLTKILLHTRPHLLADFQAGRSPGPAASALPADTVTPMNTGPFINLSSLQQLSSGDPALVRKAVSKFVDTAPESLRDLRQKYERSEWLELARSAHKFKSSSGLMGIAEVQNAMERIEHIIKHQQDPALLPPILARVEEVMHHALAELRDTLGAP